MLPRSTTVLSVLVAVWVAAAATSAAAHTIRYVLTEESRIESVCRRCEVPAPPAEILRGSFNLTVLPLRAVYAVEAVTGVEWRSASFAVTGTGFLQRLVTDRVAMVIAARVNDASVLLTSGRRRPSTPGEIRMHLTTPRRASAGYVLMVVAVPVQTDGPDADDDGVPDSLDNCPATSASDQHDDDHDGVGNACDACAGTAFGSPVSADGCAPSQRCACDGPTPDEEWSSQREYVQCVARTLRQLHQRGQLPRSEVRRMIQDAVRSGCGRRALALLR